jgi:hypothetical protein
MQPSFWSKKLNNKNGTEWYQDGTNIKYEFSDYTRDINDVNVYRQKNYMQLKFDFSFTHEDDEITCCYTVPYTYTEL